MSLRRTALVALAALAIGAGAPIVEAAPAAPARPVGGQPLDDVLGAATTHARADCGLTPAFLAAMMLSVVFHETGATGSQPPSPMTLSRYDVNAGLFAFGDPNTPYRRAYWNPGVGMWQYDSAGLGRPRAASYFMNTATAAPAVAQYMAGRFCSVRAANPTFNDGQLRSAVWSAWNACAKSSNCETVFAEIYDYPSGTLRPQTRFENVTRTGGMQARRCLMAGIGAVVDCWWVNPALAEGYGAGNVAWANPNVGASPLSAPFYVYEYAGREYRHWLAIDSGYAGDINGTRLLTANARNGGVTWSGGPGVCDLTAGRGSCPVEPPLGPAAPAISNSSAIVGSGRGVGATGIGSTTVLAERRTDGRLRLSYAQPPFWTGWQDLGGTSGADPDVASFGSDHISVVARGTDGAVYRNVLAGGGSSGWTSLGGSTTSAPAAASSAPGRIDVFARGGDGALWTGSIVNGVFGGWTSRGGFFLGDPEVTSWGPGRLDVFAVGGDRALWHLGYENGTWFTWERIGGTLTASPGAASAAANRLAVAGRGTDGVVYTIGWNGTAWTPWTSTGGATTAAPELAGGSGGALTLLARGSDGNLYRAQGSHTGPWGPWARFP